MSNNSFKSKFNHDSANALVHQLLECAIACEACASACLNEGHLHMMARCVQLDRDCADTCLHTAKLITRNSEISDALIVVCEKICRSCATECRTHEKSHCQECADACELCADACHEHLGNLQLK